MKYFAKVTTFEDAKALYKKLAIANHPDMGGDTATMQEINAEFDMVFSFLSRRAPVESKTSESASGYRDQFYTQHGWKGDKYNSSLHGKEIAKLLREYVKYVYPTWKFSIVSSHNTIDVSLMEGPMSPFIDKEEAIQKAMLHARESWQTESEIRKRIDYSYEMKGDSVNHFWLDEDYCLSDFTRIMFKDINSFLIDYTRDDSDAMIDYFDCNLYRSFYVGKWDKPFAIVAKTARISPTKVVKGAKLLTK